MAYGPESFILPKRQFLLPSPALLMGDGILEDANVMAVADAAALGTPVTRFIAGSVVVKRASSGEYVEADDANGDANAVASVVSDEAPDAGWDDAVITCVVNGITIAVTLASDDDTLAEVIAALEADALFAAFLTAADDGGGLLQISTRQAGGDAHLKVTCDLATAFGADGKEDSGEWADYRVVNQTVDMLDINGSITSRPVSMIRGGANFDESELYFLTGEAKRALAGRGCNFY